MWWMKAMKNATAAKTYPNAKVTETCGTKSVPSPPRMRRSTVRA
jgi:hypothetical protein